MTSTHRGQFAGKLAATRSPVTTADKSPTVCSRFITIRAKASKPAAEAALTAKSMSAGRPNMKKDAIMTGMSAMITCNMIERVVIRSRIWGEADT